MEKIQIVITNRENLRLIIKKQKEFEKQAESRRSSQMEISSLQSLNYSVPVVNQNNKSARGSVSTLPDLNNDISHRSLSSNSSDEDEEDDEVDELPVPSMNKHGSFRVVSDFC